MNITFIIGTRPELLKINSLVKELKKKKIFKIKILSTMQQKKLFIFTNKIVNQNIDFYLKNSNKLSMSQNISRINEELNNYFRQRKTDFILVQGDTLSTFVGALYGFLNNIKVIHLEAGMRTYDKEHPWPEEIFRQNISKYACLHLAMTKKNKENLINEKIRKNNIKVVGNPGIDSMLEIIKKSKFKRKSEKNKVKYILITIHRKEAINYGLKEFCKKLKKLIKKKKNYQFFWILHTNSEIRKIIFGMFRSKTDDNLSFLEPLSPDKFYHYLINSNFVLTDSGGVQEEAAYLGIPSLIVRNKTERNEIIELKLGKIIGVDGNSLLSSFNFFENNKLSTKNISKWRKIQGNGKSGVKTANIINCFFLENK